MKRLICICFLIMILFLFTGCSKQEELTCNLLSTRITITVKNGKIIRYYDEIKGESSSDDIETLNDHYLKDVNNNEEALKILKNVIATNGGSCNDEEI